MHQQKLETIPPVIGTENKKEEEKTNPLVTNVYPHQPIQNISDSENQTDNICIIMDSNRKFVNFRNLFKETIKGKITVLPCGDIGAAEKILSSHNLENPKKILLHIGVNDLDNERPEKLTDNSVAVAQMFQEKYHCQVYISEITPRKDIQEKVQIVNKLLEKKLNGNKALTTIKNNNLEGTDLHDDRHLKRNKTLGQLTSGVQKMIKNIFETITNKKIESQLLETSLNKFRNSYFSSFAPKYQRPRNPHHNRYQRTRFFPPNANGNYYHQNRNTPPPRKQNQNVNGQSHQVNKNEVRSSFWKGLAEKDIWLKK